MNTFVQQTVIIYFYDTITYVIISSSLSTQSVINYTTPRNINVDRIIILIIIYIPFSFCVIATYLLPHVTGPVVR